MMPPEHIDLRELEAFLFDLDGVVTRTASVHADGLEATLR